MAIDFQDLSPEQIQRGMACKTLEEFKAFVGAEGLDLDDAETQAAFDEMNGMELSEDDLDNIAGGAWRWHPKK